GSQTKEFILPAIPFAGTFLVFSSLGGNATSKGDVLKHAFLLCCCHVDLLILCNFLGLLTALHSLALERLHVSLIHVWDRFRVPLCLFFGLFCLLVDSKSKCIEL